MAFHSSAKCHVILPTDQMSRFSGDQKQPDALYEVGKGCAGFGCTSSAFETRASSGDQGPRPTSLRIVPRAQECPASPSFPLVSKNEASDSSTDPLPLSPKVGSQIWQTTIGFLEKLKVQFPEASPDSLFSVIASLSSSSPAIAQVSYPSTSLLMHALRISMSCNLTPIEDPLPPLPQLALEKKRHLKSRLRHYYGKSGRSRKNSRRRRAKSSGRLRAKTGRKPQEHECFLCHSVCPYKVDLIEHLQESHGLHRSQSLLYKRLSQGPESMLRLYSLA